jgi:hypothetical protein
MPNSARLLFVRYCSILSKINALWDGPPNSATEVLKMNAMTRNLKINVRGAALAVPVRVFWPVEDKGGWDCRWEIVWPDRQRANSGCGTDAIQALLNALQMVGAEIYCSEDHRSGKLSWDDNWSGYGFPVSGNIRDLLAGNDKKYL